MEDVEVMTVIKEKIDRLTDDLSGSEQKMTFLEQSIEKGRAELDELKATQADLMSQEQELRGKIKK